MATSSGSVLQGDCPKHGSSSGRCLTIYPGTQSFYCFHCGAGGDVIGLVEFYNNCDHRTAVNYLAERCGMPPLGSGNRSQEDQARFETERQEERLVQEMLTEATRFYHEKLADFPQVKDHLLTHYGFSEAIIEEHQIGFAPPAVDALVKHLSQFQQYDNHLFLTSLVLGFPAKPPVDYFQGRIIFPYWHNGKVVFMKGRAMAGLTPVNVFECYTDKEGNLKQDAQGQPEFKKYKALMTYNPENDDRKSLSRFVQNTIMGMDSIRGAKEIIITEGAPDLISALDKGFAAISPVTTRFSDHDIERLEELTRHAEAIYLINDNEENQAGRKGAIKTGVFLTKSGRNVFLVELPRPIGLTKIDLNEYLRDHSADDLRKLMEESKSVLEVLIEELPQNFLKAHPKIQTDIAPILTGLEGGVLEYYVEQLTEKDWDTQSGDHGGN